MFAALVGIVLLRFARPWFQIAVELTLERWESHETLRFLAQSASRRRCGEPRSVASSTVKLNSGVESLRILEISRRGCTMKTHKQHEQTHKDIKKLGKPQNTQVQRRAWRTRNQKKNRFTDNLIQKKQGNEESRVVKKVGTRKKKNVTRKGSKAIRKWRVKKIEK